jgi:hypothetical protein
VFGLEVLDVAIGIALVYFLFSLVAASIVEAIESVIKSRAMFLERGVRELLDDRSGTCPPWINRSATSPGCR